MNLFQLSTISILISGGFLSGCMSDNQQDIKNDGSASNTVNSQSSGSTASTPPMTAPGMKVYIDPDTGEFLEKPPEGAIPIDSATTQTGQNSNNTGSGSSKKKEKVYKEKQSTTPGGGTYIEVPPPY